MSLNGKIATKDGSVDWLETIPNPDKTDYGYEEMYGSIGSTIQGYATYQQILDWGIEFPYKGKANYVLTRKEGLANTEDVTFVSNNHISFIQNLKEESQHDIWLIGGGQINTLLFNAGLVDEIQVFVMPIVLSGGIELFEAIPDETHLILKGSKTYSSGVVELLYHIDSSNTKA